MLKTSLQLHKL